MTELAEIMADIAKASREYQEFMDGPYSESGEYYFISRQHHKVEEALEEACKRFDDYVLALVQHSKPERSAK